MSFITSSTPATMAASSAAEKAWISLPTTDAGPAGFGDDHLRRVAGPL